MGDWGGEFTSYEMSDFTEVAGAINHTLGKTGTQETRDLLDQGVGSNKGVVLACELLDQLLVLVELLQIIGRHGVDTTVLSTIDIVLITENAIPWSVPLTLLCISVCVPDGHSWAGDNWEANGSGETLVTLGVIVLEADLELNGLEEVSLLGLGRVFE